MSRVRGLSHLCGLGWTGPCPSPRQPLNDGLSSFQTDCWVQDILFFYIENREKEREECGY